MVSKHIVSRELLESIIDGNTKIDKEFRRIFRGCIYSHKDIKKLSSENVSHFEFNLVLPYLLKSLHVEGTNEIQILKGLSVFLHDIAQDALKKSKQ